MDRRQHQVNAKLKFRFKMWVGVNDHETTVDIKLGILHAYEEFFGKSLLKCGNAECFIKYKDYIIYDRGRGLSTLLSHMNTIKEFYNFLYETKEYSRYVKFRDLRHLTITRSQRNALNSSKNMVDMPTINDWKKIIKSIVVKTAVDLRDRALIVIALFGPSRIDTYRSLLLKHLKIEIGVIVIDPTKDASVKKNYANWGRIIIFEPEYYKYFLDYLSYLEEIGFSSEDPLFPTTVPYRLDENGELPYDRLSTKRYSSPNSLNGILKKRSIACGVKYHSFHRYRDLHSYLGEKCCPQSDQLRAFKQNFGHLGGDTFDRYYGGGNTQKFKRMDILNEIDFSRHSEKQPTVRDLVEKLKRQDVQNKKMNEKLDSILKLIQKPK